MHIRDSYKDSACRNSSIKSRGDAEQEHLTATKATTKKTQASAHTQPATRTGSSCVNRVEYHNQSTGDAGLYQHDHSTSIDQLRKTGDASRLEKDRTTNNNSKLLQQSMMSTDLANYRDVLNSSEVLLGSKDRMESD